MVNISSKAEARKRIREAQNKANGERAARERQTADDTATLVVALDRLKAVDQWEQNRIAEVRAEADRRRHQHRLAGAAALARMQGRGETLAAIAELAGVQHPRTGRHAESGAGELEAAGGTTRGTGGRRGAGANHHRERRPPKVLRSTGQRITPRPMMCFRSAPVVSHRRCTWSSDVGSLEDQFEEGAYVRVEEVIACRAAARADR